MREAVLAAVTTAPSPDEAPAVGHDGPRGTGRTPDRVAAHAIALRAALAEAADATRDGVSDPLSTAERQLLGAWLDRLAGGDSERRPPERASRA